MHPALRKGPLFTNTPPFSTFLQPPIFHSFTKKTLHFISCLLACVHYPSSSCCIQLGDLKYSGMVSSIRAITLYWAT